MKQCKNEFMNNLEIRRIFHQRIVSKYPLQYTCQAIKSRSQLVFQVLTHLRLEFLHSGKIAGIGYHEGVFFQFFQSVGHLE